MKIGLWGSLGKINLEYYNQNSEEPAYVKNKLLSQPENVILLLFKCMHKTFFSWKTGASSIHPLQYDNAQEFLQ